MNTHFGSTRKYARHQDRKAADKKAEEAAREKLAVNDINYPILGGGWSSQAVPAAAKPEMNYAAIAVASEVRDSGIQMKKEAAAAVARRNAFEAEAIRKRRQMCSAARMSNTVDGLVEDEEEMELEWGGEESGGGGGAGGNWIGSGTVWDNEKGDWDTVVRKKIKPVSHNATTFEAAPLQQLEEYEDPEWYNPHEKGSLW